MIDWAVAMAGHSRGDAPVQEVFGVLVLAAVGGLGVRGCALARAPGRGTRGGCAAPVLRVWQALLLLLAVLRPARALGAAGAARRAGKGGEAAEAWERERPASRARRRIQFAAEPEEESEGETGEVAFSDWNALDLAGGDDAADDAETNDAAGDAAGENATAAEPDLAAEFGLADEFTRIERARNRYDRVAAPPAPPVLTEEDRLRMRREAITRKFEADVAERLKELAERGGGDGGLHDAKRQRDQQWEIRKELAFAKGGPCTGTYHDQPKFCKLLSQPQDVPLTRQERWEKMNKNAKDRGWERKNDHAVSYTKLKHMARVATAQDMRIYAHSLGKGAEEMVEQILERQGRGKLWVHKTKPKDPNR